VIEPLFRDIREGYHAKQRRFLWMLEGFLVPAV